MGKKGKKGQAGKPKKLTPKDISKRLNALAKNLEEDLKGADLFAPLPPTEDCAICLVPLSRVGSSLDYWSCCGNMICVGCSRENQAVIKKQNEENAAKSKTYTCAFCREPQPSSDVMQIHQLEARALKNDHSALGLMGEVYRNGEHGVVKDDLKALDYFIRAAKLGSAPGCGSIGKSYREGNGVAVDKERSALFYRVGALRGCIYARHNIGWSEYYDLGNHEIAIRHWKIAAEAGLQDSLDALRRIYNGNKAGKKFIRKDYLESTYRACHEAQMEVKTEEREKHSGAD